MCGIPLSLRTLACIAAALSTIVLPDTVSAAPRVVIVEAVAGPSLPALPAQVAVQAGVETVAVKIDGPQPDFEAQALLEAHHATLVVWVVISGAVGVDTTYVVYVAGKHPDRAIMELVRVPASTPASEIERTIALKIAGLLSDVLVPGDQSALGTDIAKPRGPRWWATLGAAAVMSAGERDLLAGPSLFVSRRWQRGDWQVGAGLGARWLLSGAHEDAAGRISFDEIDASVGASIGRIAGSWVLFADGFAGPSIVLAEGSAADGRLGNATVLVPMVALGVGAGGTFGATSITVRVGAERLLIRQRFLIDESAIVDLGRTRVFVEIAARLPVY